MPSPALLFWSLISTLLIRSANKPKPLTYPYHPVAGSPQSFERSISSSDAIRASKTAITESITVYFLNGKAELVIEE
nr:hypothetical protein [Agrobacterium tumefaciens]